MLFIYDALTHGFPQADQRLAGSLSITIGCDCERPGKYRAKLRDTKRSHLSRRGACDSRDNCQAGERQRLGAMPGRHQLESPLAGE